MTHAQEIAKLKDQIARLQGEITGLRHAIAVRPYPYQYIPAPTPIPRPYVYPQPYYTYQNTSGIAAAQGLAQANVQNLQGANGAAA